MGSALKRLLLIIILIIAGAHVAAEPVEQAVVRELAALYRLDTSQYVIDIETNRLRSEDVSPGQLTLRPLSQKEPLGLFTVAATVSDENGMVESAQLRLRISKFADVLVATGKVGTREMLTPDKFEVRRMDVTQLFEKPITSFDDVAGYRAARNIRMGTVLTAPAVEIPPDVEAGTQVSIVYEDGRCRISTPGTVLQPGSNGEYVKVRNASSGKIIMARVVDGSSVAVDP
jgi:flagella basal body P-ring formation protein FlgA